ncbi:MAG: hypothetical protein LBT53_07325 [Puniceicoccales bacterium]|jgi:hypothetical protein|nr:hypothetical protein [Puniceicoccales bacterium]
MKNHKKLICVGVIILCAILLSFFLRGKDTIDVPSVARIYDLPSDALTLLDVTRQEDIHLRNEKQSRWKDARRDVDVIAAYEIFPKVPFTFFPVRIVITTIDKFPARAIRSWQRFEEMKMEEKKSPMITSYNLKYEKFFVRHQENNGSESGAYFEDGVLMSVMEDDGSFSSGTGTGHLAFIFENHNAKEKYSIRIIQSVLMSSSSRGIVELKPIKGGKRYFSEWHYSKDADFDFEQKLAMRVDLIHIFNSLKEATINHIEETGVVEKFYAKRAAEKTQQPQAPKP